MSSPYQHRIYDSIYVSSDGNVGIGTSSPVQLLHVEGTINANVITNSEQTLQLQMPHARVTLR